MRSVRPRLVREGTDDAAYYHTTTNEYFLVREHGGSLESAWLACVALSQPVPPWLTEVLDDDGAAFVASDGRKYSYRDGDAHNRRQILDWLVLFRAPKPAEEVSRVDSTTAVSE